MEERAAIARTLRASRRVLIVCHVGPDGDCLGAGLALAAALDRLGVAATVASPDGVPPSLRFLPGAGEVVTGVDDADAVQVAVTMECSTLDRSGPLEAAVRRAGIIAAIDHHADHTPYAHLTDWDPAAAAVGEQVADLIGRLGVPIDRPIALGLLTALVTDTGVFRYANTTPRTLRLAADLVERGATIHEIVRAVYEDQPPSALRLLGHALAGLTLHHGGAVATTLITPAMLAAAGATGEEVSGIAGVLRTIAGVRVAMTFEDREGGVRVSIRTRNGARADRVARALGGGGHRAAAGAEVSGTLRDVVRRALDAAALEVTGGADDAPEGS
ncbi:MAG: DHH family phosphoesterase [Armatimonadota bacterium]|nr:DHH family phosphoesterase [Armatimonadota bacterium]MDR7518202.1 DHH family phosphoesterase [Armatimonadota bacterium]